LVKRKFILFFFFFSLAGRFEEKRRVRRAAAAEVEKFPATLALHFLSVRALSEEEEEAHSLLISFHTHAPARPPSATPRSLPPALSSRRNPRRAPE
jgi:hypothetical protein